MSGDAGIAEKQPKGRVSATFSVTFRQRLA